MFLRLIIILFFLYLFLKVVDIAHDGVLKLGELLLFSIVAKFASRSFSEEHVLLEHHGLNLENLICLGGLRVIIRRHFWEVFHLAFLKLHFPHHMSLQNRNYHGIVDQFLLWCMVFLEILIRYELFVICGLQIGTLNASTTRCHLLKRLILLEPSLLHLVHLLRIISLTRKTRDRRSQTIGKTTHLSKPLVLHHGEKVGVISTLHIRVSLVRLRRGLVLFFCDLTSPFDVFCLRLNHWLFRLGCQRI